MINPDGNKFNGIDFEDWKGVPIATASNVPLQQLIPMLRTRVVYDMVPDKLIKPWSANLGVVPASPEGYVVEQAAATIRRNALAPIIGAISVTSALAADIGFRATLMTLGSGSSEPDGNVATLPHSVDETHVRLTLASVMSVIANLIDLEVLTYGRAVRR